MICGKKDSANPMIVPTNATTATTNPRVQDLPMVICSYAAEESRAACASVISYSWLLSEQYPKELSPWPLEQ